MIEKRYDIVNETCNRLIQILCLVGVKLEYFKYFIKDTKENKYLTISDTIDLLNELSEEIMSLRWENTKLKLVLKDIVEDLETEAERKVPIIIQKEYVDWVKSDVNLRLNSSKLNRPGDLYE